METIDENKTLNNPEEKISLVKIVYFSASEHSFTTLKTTFFPIIAKIVYK